MAINFLEKVWEQREVTVYPQIFGELGEGIYPVPASVFSETFEQEPDPRWLHVGVFACPPSEKRDHWLYLSSGLTNPWELESPPEDRTSLSGLGAEYVFETSQPGDWAIQLLHRVIAFDLLLSHGRYPNREALAPGDRIPLGGSIQPQVESLITWLQIAKSPVYGAPIQLESGEFYLLQVIGITEAEARLSRDQGLEPLLTILQEGGAYPVTNPERSSLVGAT